MSGPDGGGRSGADRRLRLGELASASLDGALSPTEEAELQRAVAADADLRSELDGLAQVRGAVRALPPVDPPFGSIERVVMGMRRGRPWTHSAGALAAAAAAIVLVVGISPGPRATEVSAAEIDDMTARHGAVTSDPTSVAAPVASGGFGAQPMAPDDVDEVPVTFAGEPLEAAFRDGGTLQVVYGAGPSATSVYVQVGDVDWNDLATRGGRRFSAHGDVAWRSTSSAADVVVVDRGSTVFVVVAAEVDPRDLDALADPPSAWLDVVGDACGGVVETFGFEG